MNALVTPEVLFWARDSSGYSMEDIVKKLKLEKETVAAWEEGIEQPTYTQIEKLANIYKRPIAVFFFPQPPEEDNIQQKLRAVPENYAKSLSPEIRYIVRKAQARQIDLSEIYGDVLPNDFQDFKRNLTLDSDIQTLASTIREVMGVSLKEQFDWKNSKTAFKKWRNKLESIGIWVFKEPFKDESYSGFCLCDENFPVVYINNSMSDNRKIFTLFHELGHLLIDKSGVDFRQNIEDDFTGIYHQEEVFCNAFSGEFLVPNNSMNISSAPNDEQISNYAKKYNVSREVILRKYLNKEIITQEFYSNKIKEWRSEWLEKEQRKNTGEKTSGGPSYYVTQKSYLGDKYLKVAFSQYYQNRISEAQLADYLGVKVKFLRGLEG